VITRFRGEGSIAELCRKEGINQNSITAGLGTSWTLARRGWRVTPPARRLSMRTGVQADRPGAALKPPLLDDHKSCTTAGRFGYKVVVYDAGKV
jgi:hypothetical protein